MIKYGRSKTLQTPMCRTTQSIANLASDLLREAKASKDPEVLRITHRALTDAIQALQAKGEGPSEPRHGNSRPVS